jgi:hypothetical protein
MREIYAMTWAALRAAWPVILTLATLLVGFEVWADPGRLTLITLDFALTTGLAYLVHRHVLLGERMWALKADRAMPPARMGRFLMIAIAVWAALFAMMFQVIDLLEPMGRARGLPLSIAIMLLLLVLLLSAFGLVLPAAAVETDFRLGRALRRSLRAFPQVLGGLLAGPVLAGGVASVVAVGIDQFTRDLTVPHWVAFVLTVLFEAIGLVVTLMIAVALSRAYRRQVAQDAASAA